MAGALLADMAKSTAVVALDALGGTARATLSARSTFGAGSTSLRWRRALGAVTGKVVTAAGEALLALTSRIVAGGGEVRRASEGDDFRPPSVAESTG